MATEGNLKAAFAGESQANRRYLYFASKADVEGYNDVAAVFRSTAEGETGHAHGHLEYLEAVGDPATGLPIGSTRDNLRAAIAGAEAAVASAERELSKLRINAPFAGLLETDAAEIGALLQPGGACATVIQLDFIKLVGFVPEIDVAKIEVGARAGARLASGETITGTVSFIARSADPMTRTFRVEVEAPNTDLAIRDGQTVEIMVAADGRPAHLLPQSALTLDDDGRIGVRLLAEGNVVAFAPVDILRDTIDGVWLSGLEETAEVITVGQEYVVDGVTVDPTFREASE